MTGNKLLSKLLHMKGFRVKDYWFTQKTLDIIVRTWKNGCQCPKCGQRGRIVYIHKSRRIWKDVHLCRYQVRFFYTPKEIKCPTHGRIQEHIPWAAPNAQITERLEYLVLWHAKRMAQKAAAQLLGLSTSTFSDILHRAINRHREKHRIRGLKVIGIDEISYQKGKKFATVVYDLDRSEVVWVGKGKGRETIDRFFTEVLSLHQRKAIRFGVSDMSPTYMNAIIENCPNITLILDRFHVVKALNEAMDEVRKEQWRELLKTGSKQEIKALKGLRWILYRHSSNRSPQDNAVLQNLKKANNRIYRAWLLKDELELLWDFDEPQEAEAFAKKWITRALKSRIESMRGFANTLKKHLTHVIAFIKPRITNAIAEGINRIIRMIKNRASGFRTFDAFADIIYLGVGDLNIEEQVPQRHRTLPR